MGDQLGSTLKAFGPSQHNRIEVLKRGPYLGPIMPRHASVSDVMFRSPARSRVALRRIIFVDVIIRFPSLVNQTESEILLSEVAS